jgi:phage shock protein PspC (stress-responsive transcriptional regulator)/predicted membrane protein
MSEPPNGAPPDVPAPAAPAPPERRRLTRSRQDRWLGGVAGGLADYLDIDPLLVRLVFVIAAILSAGTMILIYIGGWILIPEADSAAAAAPRAPRSPGHRSDAVPLAFGLLLVVVGGIALLRALDIPAPRWDVSLAVLLILVGVLIIFAGKGGIHGGLLVLAIGLTVVLSVGALAFGGVRWQSGFGDRLVQVTTPAQLDDIYSHAFGSMTVDLSRLDLPPGTTRVEVRIAFGDLVVRIPQQAEYRIEGRTWFGSAEADGRTLSEGISGKNAHQSTGYAAASERLLLDIRTSFGSTSVVRR